VSVGNQREIHQNQNKVVYQIITASQRQSTINRQNENIQKEPDKNELITHIEPKNNINYNLNSSFEESVKMFPDMPEWGGNGITKGYGIKQMPGYK